MISTMSFPYQFVENYSTPTTPHASPWEVDQNPAEMFVQEQCPPPQIQQTYEPPPTIQLQEQPQPDPDRVVPTQQRHELHSGGVPLYRILEARPEGNGGDHQPQSPLVDTSPTGSSSSVMPIRHTPTRPHLQLASHPYRRPQSATGGSVRTPRERQHVRFASSGRTAGASNPPRMTSFPAGPSSAPAARGPSSSPVTSPHQSTVPSSTAPRPERPEQPRRFIIRADVHYDAESKVITAMLELPGVKKADLSVKLSTCWYNRVRQVIIAGKSAPLFADETGFAVRERKHGEFFRTFAVPPDTRIEDVHAEMQDGLLLLRIACHMPVEREDGQDIQIH